MDGPLPVPVRLTDCWLPAVLLLLSVMVRVAVRIPAAVGENATLIVQLPLAARELPHVLVWVKSPGLDPENPTPVIDNAWFPVLFKVTVWAALVEPRFWPLKVKLVVATPARGALPVPVRLTACGLLGALSVIVTEAVRVPGAVGAKVTLTVHVPPGPTELLQVLVAAKSPPFAPVARMLLIFKVAFPLLVRVTACAALVDPTDWLE